MKLESQVLESPVAPEMADGSIKTTADIDAATDTTANAASADRSADKAETAVLDSRAFNARFSSLIEETDEGITLSLNISIRASNAPDGCMGVKLDAPLGNYDRQTNRPTNRSMTRMLWTLEHAVLKKKRN